MTISTKSTLDQMREHLDLFHCPSCADQLVMTPEITCRDCGHVYPIKHDIPCLYLPTDFDPERESTTHTIRCFYEKTPFPNYEELESIEDLVRKADKGLFARLLNDQIPYNTTVLEVGCGTGQLSNYLGVAQRTVFGADMSLNPLGLANEFKMANALDNVGFYQMNLYRPIFREESFDVLICNGVLCAAADPDAGFRSICKLVKRGGYILIGLYNRYGRLVTDMRRGIINLFGERFKILDPHLRKKSLGERKKEAWFADQYRHPNEVKHTFGDLLAWFDETGFEFVYGIPSPSAMDKFSESDALFEPHPRGNRLDHILVQSRLAVQGSYEGGFFTMIARRS